MAATRSKKDEAPSHPSAVSRRESPVMDILCRARGVAVALLAAVLLARSAGGGQPAETASIAATDEPRGWLVIEGGSFPTYPSVAEKFRELIGSADSKVLLVTTALADS